jgi:histidinol-phosphate/aromatic aminotransferase/cobyric acid decarboxylase-like protein
MENGSVVCADPTYHNLIRYAERADSKIIRVPVDPDTKHVDLTAMHNAIRKDTRCAYLANRNNPIPSIIEKIRCVNSPWMFPKSAWSLLTKRTLNLWITMITKQ